MSKRLEQIKNERYFFTRFKDSDLYMDWKYLIEQAERVKELEEYNELAYNRIVKVEEQNQRYKQALEESYQELQNLHSRSNVLPSHVDVKDILNTVEYVGLTVIKQALQEADTQ